MSSAPPHGHASTADATDLLTRERSLDPESWDAMRALGHRMIDDVMTYLASIGDRPVWQKPTASAMKAPKNPQAYTARQKMNAMIKTMIATATHTPATLRKKPRPSFSSSIRSATMSSGPDAV